MEKNETKPLELGKRYITRDGQVTSELRLGTGLTENLHVGYVNNKKHCWYPNGRYFPSSEMPLDLVAEYIEPFDLSELTPIHRDPTAKRYMLLSSKGLQPPRYVHETIEGARTEAERLAKEFNCTVKILLIEYIVEPIEVTTIETKTTEAGYYYYRKGQEQAEKDGLPF